MYKLMKYKFSMLTSKYKLIPFMILSQEIIIIIIIYFYKQHSLLIIVGHYKMIFLQIGIIMVSMNMLYPSSQNIIICFINAFSKHFGLLIIASVFCMYFCTESKINKNDTDKIYKKPIKSSFIENDNKSNVDSIEQKIDKYYIDVIKKKHNSFYNPRNKKNSIDSQDSNFGKPNLPDSHTSTKSNKNYVF